MKIINIIFNIIGLLLYTISAYSAENMTDILAMMAGMVQCLICIINLNNYPSA
ncbi:MAG: hypothetical protein V4620_07650 [Bacteroidota bacterium]